MRRLHAWDSFWGALGFLRRNRRQRHAVGARRRDLRRRHRMDALEQRVVLNADPVAVDDEYLVGAASPIQTGDYAPSLANDTDNDGDELGLFFDGNPNAQIVLNGGDTYSWRYLTGDNHGGLDAGQVLLTAEGTSTTPFVYVENSGLRESGPTYSVNVRLSHANPGEYVTVNWELQTGSAQEGSDYIGVFQEAYTTEVWHEPYATQEWVESGYYESQWVPNLVNEPIWIDAQYDEFGQLVQEGYSQDNWVDYGGYQDVYVTTSSWEYHYVDGFWSTEYHAAAFVTSGTIVFQPGEIERTLEFGIVADGETEPPESFTVHLTSAGNADLTAWSDGTITLLDNVAPTPRDDEYTLYTPWDFSGGYVDVSQLNPSLTNDLDLDADELVLYANYNPGTAYANPGDTISYAYGVVDSAGNVSWANVQIHVVNESAPPANNAPTAADDVYTVYAPYGSGGVTINWADYVPDLGNDSDPEGDTLTVVANNNPNGWQWIGAGQSASYTYTIDDGNGNQSTASVVVQVEEEAYSPPNSAPTAVDDNYTVYAPYGSGGVTINWADYAPDLGNDSDPDGDGLSVVVNNNPNGWQWIGVGESASYTYTIDDGNGNQSTASVVVQVEEEAYSPPNSAPTAVDDDYTAYAPYSSGGVTINWADYAPDLGNDSDPDGDTLTVVANNNPNGWQWIGAGQSASYTYTVDDGNGNQSTASVTVRVAEEQYVPPNSAPTAVDDYYVLTLPFSAGHGTYDLSTFSPDLSNDSDPDGDGFEVYSNSVPASAYTGPGETLSYSYSIIDSFGNVSSAMVYITVVRTPNTAPSFTPDADLTVAADAGFVVVADWATNLLAGSGDEAQQTLTFELSIDDPAEQALFTELPVIQPDGTLWFTTSGVVGTAHVKVRLHDDGGTDDGGVDTSPEYTLTIQCYAGSAEGGGPSDPVDPPTAVVGFGQSSEVVNEDDDHASFTLTLSEAVDHAVSVTWHTVADTAYAGVHFQSVGGVLTFAAGETSKSIQVPLINDGVERELERTFQVVLTAAEGADLAEIPAAFGTIVEDDVSVSISDAIDVEGPADDLGNARELLFWVTLSHASEHDITVDYTTVGITADAGDFESASGSITFAAGETTKEIRVRIVDDSASSADPSNELIRRGEDAEQLKVVLSSTDPRVTVAVPYGVGTIIDDDWKQWDVVEADHRTYYQEWYDGANYSAGDLIGLDPYSYGLNGDNYWFEVPEYWSGGLFWTSFLDPLYGWTPMSAPETVQPIVTVEALDANPVDETGVAHFRIRVSGAESGQAVTVNYATHGLTAESDVDFEAVDDDSVTITGNGYVDVAVNILADALTETAESLMLYVKSIVGASLGTALFAVAQVKQPLVKSVKFLTSEQDAGTTGKLIANGNDFMRSEAWSYNFFPDAQLGETEGRNVVRVRAVVEGLQEGDRVYFMAYDVDDASRADAGDKTAPQGNDNYGRLNLSLDAEGGITDGHHTPGDPGSVDGFAGLMRGVGADGTAHVWHGYPGDPMGNLPLVSGIVRRDFLTGEYYAEAELLTSFQPGDNFRVVAMPQPKGGDPNWDVDDGELPEEITEAFADLHFENAKTGDKPQENGMAASGTLTVWRYLHMEVDQMAPSNVLGDSFAGTIAENLGMMGSHGWLFSLNVPGEAVNQFNKNSLEGGLLRIGDENFEIISSGAAVDGKVEVIVKRDVGRQLTASQFNAGSSLTMYEDDFKRPDGNPNGTPTLRVDMSADLVTEAKRYMQSSFRSDQNKFADAFIMPEYDVLAQYSGSLEARNHWEESWTNQDGVNYDGAVADQNGSKQLGSDVFWTSYVGIGYQYTSDRDFDTDVIVNGGKSADGDESASGSEGSLGYGKSVAGITTDGELFKNSVVFAESIWDNYLAHRALSADGPGYAQAKTAEAQLARTFIHEVGHQFWLGNTSGIMSEETLGVREASFDFIADDLQMIRKWKQPGQDIV
ncbi:MAG: hypothetical protein C0483_00920 [Pirellula sp.]|nr:hypothetical protein [Pirellula sp.]